MTAKAVGLFLSNVFLGVIVYCVVRFAGGPHWAGMATASIVYFIGATADLIRKDLGR